MAESLNPADRSSLSAEQGPVNMSVGGVLVFEGGEGLRHEAVLARLEQRLHLIPRYRQRIRSVPLELGRPVWVDDPHFDLNYHVRVTALVEPDDAALCALMGRLMGQELDRRRPLWEVWIVHGLKSLVTGREFSRDKPTRYAHVVA